MYAIKYEQFTKTNAKTMPDSWELKPVKHSVTYNKSDLNSTLIAAARMSLSYNATYIVTPTAYGYKMHQEGKYAVCSKFYKVDGRSVEVYEQFVLPRN